MAKITVCNNHQIQYFTSLYARLNAEPNIQVLAI